MLEPKVIMRATRDEDGAELRLEDWGGDGSERYVLTQINGVSRPLCYSATHDDAVLMFLTLCWSCGFESEGGET